MPSLSFLRCMAVVLLIGATAKAQSLEGDVAPQPLQPLEPLEPAVTTVTHAAHPTGRVVDGAARILDIDWLDLSNRPPRHTAWLTAEYALIWLNEPSLPPLITSSASGIPIGTAAVLGRSTTAIRLGGNYLDANPSSGLRFSAGSWGGCLDDRGLEIGGFFMMDRSKSFRIAGSGEPNSVALARPIVNSLSGFETALYTAFPERFAGGASATQDTSVWGMDVNGLFRLTDYESPFSFALLAGVRYLDFDQSLEIQNLTTPLGAFTVPVAGLVTLQNPNFARLTDVFQTSNRFLGGQLGMRSTFEIGRLGLGLGFKLGFGVTRQAVVIRGQSEGLTPDGKLLATAPGGLLANVTNIGRADRDGFSAVPEGELKIAYRFTDNIYAFFGYNYLLWSATAMPGNQFSRVVNPNNVPTSGAYNVGNGGVGHTPIIPTDFNLNSISFGICFTY